MRAIHRKQSVCLEQLLVSNVTREKDDVALDWWWLLLGDVIAGFWFDLKLVNRLCWKSYYLSF